MRILFFDYLAMHGPYRYIITKSSMREESMIIIQISVFSLSPPVSLPTTSRADRVSTNEEEDESAILTRD